MQKQQTQLCVLGSANVDYFVYLHHIPLPGQTIQADSYMTANGGKGANQAAALAKLLNAEKGKCIFLGQVGNDDQMRSLQKQMKEAGVDLRWRVQKQVVTGKAFIYVHQETGENSIVIVGGANMHYVDKTSLPEDYKQVLSTCSYLIIQKEVPIQIDHLAVKFTKQNKDKKTINIMDCGGRDDHIPEEMLNYLDYISPNQTQLLRIEPTIANIDNEEALVSEIREKLIKKHPNLKVLLKLGSKGSAIVTADLFVQGPTAVGINPKVAQEYKVIDTVGAGDCFTGAFAVIHSQINWDQGNKAENYRKALVFANSCAFLCITRKGAMPSMPKRQEVDEFMKKYDIK